MQLNHALKEWAVICRALAEGRQAILMRKGGLAERTGDFELEHARFWLYPTFVHQQQPGIKPEARSLLEQAEGDRPPAGIVRLSHFAEAPRVCRVDDLDAVLALQDLHCLSEQTVRARFAYRQPGLCVLPLRVFRAALVHDAPESVEYAGCKSWVELEQALDTGAATPVLDAVAFEAVLRRLDACLQG